MMLADIEKRMHMWRWANGDADAVAAADWIRRAPARARQPGRNPVMVLSGRPAAARRVSSVWRRISSRTMTPTHIVDGRVARVHRMSPGPDRWRERSRFFPGVAAAMADQWGGLLTAERSAAAMASRSVG